MSAETDGRGPDTGGADTRVMGAGEVPRTRPMPQVDVEPEPDERDREIEELRRQLRGNRILTAGLGVGVLILIAVMIALASGAFSPTVAPPTVPQQELGQDAGAAGGEDSPAAGDSDEGASGNVVDSDLGALTAADLSEIVGEKWSNAQKILEAYGVDTSELVIITDDGGQVMNARNWTVTLVADLKDSDLIAVHLHHDVSYTPQGILDQLGL